MMAARPNADDDQQMVVNFMRQQQHQVPYGTGRQYVGRMQNQHELQAGNPIQSDGQSRGTPQVSLHSSECSSNNVDNSVDLMVPHHHHHNVAAAAGQLHWLARHNYHLLATKGCHEPISDHEHELDRVEMKSIPDGGVYVIGEAGSSAGLHYPRGQADGDGGGPIGRLLDANEANLWCQATEVDDRNRCHLIDESSGSPLSLQQPPPGHMLPTSFSIPTSLASRFDMTGGRSSSTSDYEEQHRRLSSAENLLLLRHHDQHLQQQHHHHHQNQQQQQQQLYQLPLAADCQLAPHQFQDASVPCWSNSLVHNQRDKTAIEMAPEESRGPRRHITFFLDETGASQAGSHQT